MGIETGILAATAAIGTGLSMYGSIKSGQDAKSAANYNATVLQDQAARTEEAGQQEATTLEEEGRSLQGIQEAKYSKAGVVFKGTPNEVMLNSLENAYQDAATTRYNYHTKALNNLAQAEEIKKKGRAMAMQGYMSAGTTLLGSAVSMGTRFWPSNQAITVPQTAPEADSLDSYFGEMF